MRNSILLASFLLVSFTATRAQTSSLKGSVADTADKKNLQNTVVSLLRASDSVLIKFTRVDQSGNFQVNHIAEGSYILMITHPYVGDYFDRVELKAGQVVDLGKVVMIPKVKLLAEIILKSGSPIRIKGDTTVYTADSFKVREGANVEELLRRLPGIQVDKNGQITAMGEKVKKVLVDGEEFFGSDPGIATKNLRADVVKEVEVYDKKSDQAEFTGIDDGIRDKTINLKLKEDKKKGYFGKAEVGGGLKDKFNNDVMMNAFKGKRKLAAYGIMSNTGQTNLDWEDAQNYGGGLDNMQSGITEDGGMWISISGGDDNYSGGRNGIPTNWNGGLHYSNKFNDGKQSLNAGYKFSKVNAPGTTRTFFRTFLGDSIQTGNSTSDNFNSVIKHALNMTIDLNLDSMNSIKWTTRANKNETKTTNRYSSETFNELDHYINNSTRSSDNNADNNSVNSTVLWKHKYKKVSRTLSLNTDFSWNNSRNKGLLHSLNNYFNDGVFDNRDTTDQQNVRNSDGAGINSRLSYTEPLTKELFLEFNYSLAYNHNSNERITTTRDINNKYSQVIDSLSNSYAFNRLVNTPGVNFKLNRKKYNLTVGMSVGFNHFVQKNLSAGAKINYDFTNFFPQAALVYKFKPSQNFRINYSGSSIAPSLDQLQPIRVNTDPLNVYLGNPDLRQSFRHNISTGYNSYNVLKERGVFGFINFGLTNNAYVQANTVDNVGKRTYQTVNADGVWYINLYSNYNFKIKDTKWRLGFGPSLNANRNVDFVNGVKNVTKTAGYGMRLNFNQWVQDKYHFDIGPEFTLQHSRASVNTSANADYWQIDGWASAGINLPKKFEVNTELNAEVREKDPRFSNNNNFTKWNAEVIKRFAKDVFELKFGVYDILNQNRGYNRNFSSFSFTETYYTTLNRYWLLTLTWNFSKNGKPTTGF